MVEIIKIFIAFINNLHDSIIHNDSFFNFTDKQLHFIVIGIIGAIIFAITQSVFKKLAKYSITAISFIYTFTLLIVIVFGIEIEQKITKRGNMEFNDILAGLYGFLYLFAIYLFIRFVVYFVKKYILQKPTENTRLIKR
jgi:hypothetical protein